MNKGIRPGTEKRCEMVKCFLEKGMSSIEISQYTRQMRGKTEEEKERIAERIINAISKVK